MKLKELPSSLYHSFRLRYLAGKNNVRTTVPVIVSLTTIPSRLNVLDIVIKNMIHQKRPPEKIVLWLHKSAQNRIPARLARLIGERFSIRYSDIDCPHLKLVESLRAFPDKIIITCDDDFIYDENWAGNLYDAHLANPDAVIANQVRQIRFDDNGTLLPYRKWNYRNGADPKTVLAIGSSGVLYPPGALHPMVTDAEKFMELSPRTDDLWFKAMELLAGTVVLKASNRPPEPIPIAGTQTVSLKKSNISENKNVDAWLKLVQYFNLDYGQK